MAAVSTIRAVLTFHERRAGPVAPRDVDDALRERVVRVDEVHHARELGQRHRGGAYLDRHLVDELVARGVGHDGWDGVGEW
jgi:hypothetical protein